MGSRVSEVLNNPWLRVVAFLAAMVWYGLITYWSSLAAVDTPFSAAAKDGRVPDWLAHGCVYCVLGFCLYMVARGVKLWSVVFVLVMVLCAAFLDEIHQITVPTRTFSLWDILADMVGAAIAILVAVVGLRLLEGKRKTL